MKVRRERKLPVQQLSILAICRFAEPIASTSLFPYLPEMVRSFGVSQNEVAGWAGLCAAIFSLCQALMGIPWGRFSDIYGRKPAILLGLGSTMVTSLMWGFSKNLPMAITARALAGAGNGNVGIIRTTVAEMVPFRELQPRAFSLMPLVWNVGSIFGPTIGGALANPLNVEPGEQIANPGFFELFPYSLPNIVSAAFFAVGITIGFLFLEETLETLQGRRDYGLLLGQKLTGLLRSHVLKIEEILHLRKKQSRSLETEPLLKANGKDINEEAGFPLEPVKEPSMPMSPPPFREVLTKQSILNLVVYTLLAVHTMGYDQLLPVYMEYPSMWTDSPYITKPGGFLKWAGGFSLDHFRIGLISTAYGVFGMLVQFYVFPPVARRLGILYCLKWCACVFPVAYFLMPFTALLPTQMGQIAACFAVMMLKCCCSIFAFPCSTILITNSASSLRILGTLNGFATSVSAVGRACGPAIGGAMFTVGVKRGFVIAPWWLFSAIAILAAIPVFWLEEGEGFGGDEEVSDEEDVDEEEEEEIMRFEGLEGEAEASGKPGPITVPTRQQIEEEEEEHAYGAVGGLLTRTNTTTSSTAMTDSTPASPSTSRRGSRIEQPQAVSGRENRADPPPGVQRRRSMRVVRRMSIPVGMRGQPISRRYSSNLGQSLGSSYHGG